MFLNNSADETKYIKGSASVLIRKISVRASFPIPERGAAYMRGDRTKSPKMHIVTIELLMAICLSSERSTKLQFIDLEVSFIFK